MSKISSKYVVKPKFRGLQTDLEFQRFLNWADVFLKVSWLELLLMKKNILTKETREDLTFLLTEYLTEEFDMDLGNLQAQLLLDFLSDKLGSYFYNAGVNDSITTLRESMESVEERIDLLREI